MAKKKKNKKKQAIYPIAMGKDWALLMAIRYSEKSKAREEKKYSRKKKHRNRDE